MTRHRIALTALAVPAILGLTAASCERRGTRDAPIDTALQDNSAPFIINGPDTYHNLALKCVGADLIIVHTRQAPPVVTPNASACKSGEAEKYGIPRVRGIVPAAN